MTSSYGVCLQSIVPMRADSSHKSEMVSQLLFGELYEVLETRPDWVRVCAQHDRYSGWIAANQHAGIASAEYETLTATEKHIAYDLAGAITSTQQSLAITAGSLLPKFDGLNCRIGKIKYIYNGIALLPGFSGENVIEKIALRYLGSPYLWGGRTPFGIDCSGFTQIVYRFLGLSLPRDAWQQAEVGQLVHFVEESQAGDLAFFANSEGKIIHTGIILKDQTIIHASGMVRIDKIDHFGIYAPDAAKYTHQLKLIRRVI